MATYNIHAGHNFKAPGASGCFSETIEARNVKNKVISLLKAQGHTVYDCTDEDGSTSNANLINIVNKQNQHKVDLDVSIHFNAFDGIAHGVEILQYDNNTTAVCNRILNKIAALGFTNRGIKDGSWLYVCSNSISPAILIECCFCDSEEDKNLYNANSMAKAIAEGILNISIDSNLTINTTNCMYRVRKTWEDTKSQIGAYSNLDNAKKACLAGYSVFDSKGNIVYSNHELYRVRKTWEDTKSQIGAYSNLDNAKKACLAGYSVFDSNGKVVYSVIYENTIANSTTETKVDSSDLNTLKDLSNDEFIQYIANIAKEDYKTNSILPSITIAQSILESGWGKSELSRKANNLFGMKASLSGNNWGSEWDGKIYTVSSKEEIDGKLVDVFSDFRLFKSVGDCVKDHGKYLANAKNGNALRYNGLTTETSYKKAAEIIQKGGYATDSKYADKLVELIKSLNLDSYDHGDDPTEDIKDVPIVSNEDIKELSNSINTITNLLSKIIELLSKIFNK